MAYKNKKHNKKHIAELRKDRNGWRYKEHIRKERLKKRNEMPATLEELEEMIKKLG